MYSGYLDTFYKKHPYVIKLSYDENLSSLLEDSTEFVASYTRNFRKIGIDTRCLIGNDNILQRKWGKEKGLKSNKALNTLFSQVKAYQPDILIIENLSLVDPGWLDMLRQEVRSIRLIAAYHCSPFNAKVINSLKGVDFVIACTPGLKSVIESMGKKCYLVYHGFDTDFLDRINTGRGSPVNDFIFSGSLFAGGEFHNDRIKLIEQILKEKINIGLYVNLENKYKIIAKQSIFYLNNFLRKMNLEKKLSKYEVFKYGKTWTVAYSDALLKQKYPPVYGIEMFNLFSRSKIVLNYHIGVAGDYAGNMRMFEVTGVGSCLLTDNKKNMNELFDPGSEVVVYDNADDCISKVIWLLGHEDERKKIALSGQQKTLKYHTVENRCKSIVDIIQRELKFSDGIK